MAVKRWPLAVTFFTYVLLRHPNQKELAAVGIMTLVFMVSGSIRVAQRNQRSTTFQLRLVLLAASLAVAAGVALYALANALSPKLYALEVKRVPGILPLVLTISGRGPDDAIAQLHLGADCRLPYKHAVIDRGEFRLWYEDGFVHTDMALSVGFRRDGGAAGGCVNLVNLPDNSELLARR